MNNQKELKEEYKRLICSICRLKCTSKDFNQCWDDYQEDKRND